MKGVQENKRSMYQTVKRHCADNQSVWSSYLPFTDAFNRFEVIFNGIDNYAQVQTLITKGVADDKQNSKDAIATKATDLCGIVRAYASKNNNQTLKKAVDYKFTSLRRKRDTLFVDTIKTIANQIEENLSNLVDYNISAIDLVELNNLLKGFNTILSSPRGKTTVRKNATTRLSVLFKEADTILKEELDGLVSNFKDANADFVNQYINARMIVDLGVRHRTKKENNTDDATNMPINSSGE